MVLWKPRSATKSKDTGQLLYFATNSTFGNGSHDIDLDEEITKLQSLSKAGDYTDIKWIVHRAGRDAMDTLWQQVIAEMHKEKEDFSYARGVTYHIVLSLQDPEGNVQIPCVQTLLRTIQEFTAQSRPYVTVHGTVLQSLESDEKKQEVGEFLQELSRNSRNSNVLIDKGTMFWRERDRPSKPRKLRRTVSCSSCCGTKL